LQDVTLLAIGLIVQIAIALGLRSAIMRMLEAASVRRATAVSAATVAANSEAACDADMTKLREVTGRLKAGADLSDADFQLLLRVLRVPRSAPDHGSAICRQCLKLLCGLDRASGGGHRANAICDAVFPLLSFSGATADARHVRLWACVAMGQFGDGRAVPALQEMLRDPNPVVRREARRVLDLLEARPERPRPSAEVPEEAVVPLFNLSATR
jgi:hypothetical protein